MAKLGMERYHSLASISIIVNGVPREYFGCSWGLRQGDLLLPFLFLLVTNSLGRLPSKMW